MRFTILALLLAACGAAGDPAPAPSTRVAIGEASEGVDATTIVGRVPPALEVETWVNAAPVTLESLRGQVVLVRWFTDGCPYCKATAPTLRALHDELADRGLAVVGLYHYKGDAPFTADEAREVVTQFGFEFPVAFDRDWRTLNRWWMNDHPDSWTSVSFLIDRTGVVRYVHTGGSYAPGSADAKQIRRWIDELLAERGGNPRT